MNEHISFVQILSNINRLVHIQNISSWYVLSAYWWSSVLLLHKYFRLNGFIEALHIFIWYRDVIHISKNLCIDSSSACSAMHAPQKTMWAWNQIKNILSCNEGNRDNFQLPIFLMLSFSLNIAVWLMREKFHGKM